MSSDSNPGLAARHVAIIGGGPAGLRAAEVAAGRGVAVTVYDAMPSVGRKFLVAGKSGLNLTNAEPPEAFLARYSHPEIRRFVEAFDNDDLREWARGLGEPTFESAGGKVFPVSMKAAPLLRKWVARLRDSGVSFRMRHRWVGIAEDRTLTFDTPGGEFTARPAATVLALGGASWPQTGSTGTWVDLLAGHGIEVTPFAAANAGWEVDWPDEVVRGHAGAPLKNIAVGHEGQRSAGELVITDYGLEGAPLYRLGRALRDDPSPSITIDFKPSLPLAEVSSRLAAVKRNFVREAARRLKLSPAVAALLKHLPHRGPWTSPARIAAEIKACRIALVRPRPIAEAISTAGGVAWSELDGQLMLRRLPGVFVAGEMLDWEAPTGGYLLQACFATGAAAGSAAASRVASSR